MLTKTLEGQSFRKSTFSGAGNDCVYLNSDRTIAHDSKGGAVLRVPLAGFLARVKAGIL